MYTPLVSVVISTYNNEKYIRRSIESILSQNYRNIEIIVIDDGSVDNTKKVVDPYIRSKNIKYIYQKNKGASVARNYAIKIASGEYISDLDADDYWIDRDKIKKQVGFLENNQEYVLVGGGMIVISEQGEEIKRYIPVKTDDEIRNLILIKNPFVHSSVMFRRQAFFLSKNKYVTREISNGISSDEWSLWLELGMFGKFYNFQEYFVVYLKNQSGASNYGKAVGLMLDTKIRKKYRHDYPNFWKGYIYGWLQYFYYFFPFKEKLHPIVSLIKKNIFKII